MSRLHNSSLPMWETDRTKTARHSEVRSRALAKSVKFELKAQVWSSGQGFLNKRAFLANGKIG